MTKNYFIKSIILLILPLRFFSQSQLSVTPNSAATQLAQDITGSGVTVSNAALNCGSGASGTFTYPSTGTNLGLTSGILLTTGAVTDVANPGSYFCDVSNGNYFVDPNLTSIDSTATNDVCILQFDFVPVCNSISVTYVFGSEEYPVYIGQYNDGFGIFLTGPNPGGGNYSGTNIATLPNGQNVSIDNVNNGYAGSGFYPPQPATNPQYFHDNYTNPNNDIAYDGYTIPITSVKPVVPCSTYHMKIAIADAGDEQYDSGVFIGGNAVSCQTAPTASIASTPASCGGSTGTASVTVSNYTATPTYSWSPGGQTTPSISGLSAGNYTCVIGFQSACSGVYTQTITTTVSNPSSFSLSTTSNPATCSGSATGSATVNVSGGTSPYTIAWNTTPTQTTNVAGNLVSGTYNVVVHDNAGCLQTASVNVAALNQTTVQFSTMQVCGNNTVLNASTGTAYQWYDTSNVLISGANAQTYSVTHVANGQHYIVSYKDNTTGCRDSMQINITKYNLVFSSFASPLCNGGNNGSITLSPSGTYTFSSYSWNLLGAATASGTSTTTPISVPSAANLGAGTYSVSVFTTGNPSCIYTQTVQLTQNAIPSPIYDTLKACNLDTVKLNPSLPSGYTNNWYKATPFSFLGSTAANVAFPVPPPQHSNATYIDTVKSATGCISIYKTSVKIQSFQNLNSILQQLKCYNDSNGKVKITVPRETNGPINHPFTFTWYYPAPYVSPATITTSSVLPVTTTEYSLHAGYYYCVIKAGNCTDTAKFTLTSPPKPHTDSLYAYYCPKDSLALVIADTGQTNYVWHPSNSVASVTGDSAKIPVASLNNYYVTYTRNNCPDTAKIIVSVTTYDAFRPDELVNVFSPNGDKINDYFYPFYSQTVNQYQIFKQSDTYELEVYDRWGKQVYSTTDYSKPWDGKTKSGHNADAGSYFFVVKYKSNCASKADLVEKKGFLELTR